jgi:glyoxylase-like metal-dependent hydrolase (beta-lactamase superfamily II)
MREVLPGIFTWSWFSERFQYDFHGTFVPDPGANLVIDPVEPPDDVLAELVRRGVSRILLTNRNHFRAAARVRDATSARVSIHAADAPFVTERGVVVDDELVPGQRIGPLVVVAAPGKSPGEVALHFPERRVLLVGDACVGNPPGRLSLLPQKVIDDAARLKESLAALARDLDFDAVLVGDGEPILEGGRRALAALVESLP